MKLTYLANGKVEMVLNMGGTVYKQTFETEQDLKNFCSFIDKVYLKIA